MADTHNQLAILLHLVDKLHGDHAAVKCLAELLCSRIQSTSETVPLIFRNKLRFNSVTLWPVCQKQKTTTTKDDMIND